MKKFLAMLLALAMCLMAAACAANPSSGETNASTGSTETTTPEGQEGDDLTTGYFTYAYAVEGMGDMVRYFHFYPDQGLGGICLYASSGGGGTQLSIGFYSVEETPFAYSCWSAREERNSEGTGRKEGTAPYTIVFTEIDGSEMGSVGYDGEYVYVDGEETGGFVIADARNMRFARDTADSYPEAYAAEVGQLLLRVEAVGDATSFVEIYHDGTYSDMVNMLIEGTYTYAEENGVKVYTLTPNDSSDAAAAITFQDNGTITYASGGSTLEMKQEVQKVLFLALTGKVTQTEYNMEAEYTMELYEDGTCELLVDMAGNAVSVDTGSYLTNASYDLEFTLNMLGALTAGGDFSDPAAPKYSMEIPAIQAFSLSEATLNYGQAEKTVAFAFTGTVTQTAYSMEGEYTLNMYDDNSCELIVTLAGNAASVDAGTYALDSAYNFALTMNTLGVLTAKGDFADPSAPVYTVEIPAVEAYSLSEATLIYGQASGT